MQDTGHITYLKQQEVNRSLWDRCIDEAPNGLVYAYAFYLDQMADHWDALVLDDYRAVMPLPWRKKKGIAYIYQPFLTAQLGLFGQDVDASLLGRFLAAIPQRFRLVEFSLNHGNRFAPPGFDLYARRNYVLDLRPGYETLQQRYRLQTKRNIRKSEKYGCRVEKEVDVAAILDLARRFNSPVAEADAEHFTALYEQMHRRAQTASYGILSREGALLASCAFLFAHGRAYYILVGNHPNGRTLGASHALIDAFIRDHAGQHLLLDFEGSDLRNLAFFYSGFGAAEENYSAVKWNRLPWYLRWAKKS